MFKLLSYLIDPAPSRRFASEIKDYCTSNHISEDERRIAELYGLDLRHLILLRNSFDYAAFQGVVAEKQAQYPHSNYQFALMHMSNFISDHSLAVDRHINMPGVSFPYFAGHNSWISRFDEYCGYINDHNGKVLDELAMRDLYNLAVKYQDAINRFVAARDGKMKRDS